MSFNLFASSDKKKIRRLEKYFINELNVSPEIACKNAEESVKQGTPYLRDIRFWGNYNQVYDEVSNML